MYVTVLNGANQLNKMIFISFIITLIVFVTASSQYYYVSNDQSAWFQFAPPPINIGRTFYTILEPQTVPSYNQPVTSTFQTVSHQRSTPQYEGYAYQTNYNGASSHVIFLTGPQSQGRQFTNRARNIASDMVDSLKDTSMDSLTHEANQFQFLNHFYSNFKTFHTANSIPTTKTTIAPATKNLNETMITVTEKNENLIAKESIVVSSRFKLNDSTTTTATESERSESTTILQTMEPITSMAETTTIKITNSTDNVNQDSNEYVTTTEYFTISDETITTSISI